MTVDGHSTTLSLKQCEDLLFASFWKKAGNRQGYDSDIRDLRGIQSLFEEADIPINIAPAITITGSKGKGSTAILCSALLQQMGERVGLLTSPSYVNHRERIRVNGRAIPEADYVRIINELALNIQAVDEALLDDQYLSPTGLFLAIAMRYFGEQNVTRLVLEVGRGGRFDDVSLIPNQVSVITPITDEHLDRLGPTIKDIAWHKTGIIKRGNTIVSAPQTDEVRQEIEKVCAEQDARLLRIGEEIRFVQTFDGMEQQLTINLPDYPQPLKLRLPTPAVYQGVNAALASAAIYLSDDISYSHQKGENRIQVRLAGRCDIISRQPLIVLDGAINRSSSIRFRDSVLPFSKLPIILITALPSDKDVPGVLEELIPHVDSTIIVQLNARHLHFSNRVGQVAQHLSSHIIEENDVQAAFQKGLSLVGKSGTLWVVGTQSLLREAMLFWKQNLETLSQ